jgi:hypothetical protein
MTPTDEAGLREAVRDHYAQAARIATEGKVACCGPPGGAGRRLAAGVSRRPPDR